MSGLCLVPHRHRWFGWLYLVALSMVLVVGLWPR